MRLLFLLFAVPLFALTELGATYEFSSGRFGDNLLSYLHAKWFTYQRSIPLLYKSFQYSSQLVLHDEEIHFLTWTPPGPRTRVYLDRSLPNPYSPIPVVYHCPYSPEDEWELSNTLSHFGTSWYRYDVDWNDPSFRKEIQRLIAPKYPLQLILPPKGKVSLAIHFREGGGYDDPLNWEKGGTNYPLKFPPLSYYFEAVEEILSLFPHTPLYAFLFTDAVNPLEALSLFSSRFPSVQWQCRTRNNAHNRNVLEDFFSLFQFDILIHPQSNFSLVPSLIHDYAISYSPAAFEIEEQRITITQTRMKKNDDLYQTLISSF